MNNLILIKTRPPDWFTKLEKEHKAYLEITDELDFHVWLWTPKGLQEGWNDGCIINCGDYAIIDDEE